MNQTFTRVEEQCDADGKFIVATLNGVPLLLRAARPEQHAAALNDARFVVAQVKQGGLHWSDGIALLALRAEYYRPAPAAAVQTEPVRRNTAPAAFVPAALMAPLLRPVVHAFAMLRTRLVRV